MTQKNSDDNIHLIYSTQVIEFVTVANLFCNFLENAHTEKRKIFIEKSQKILSILYLKSIVLKSPKIIEEGYAEKFVTQDDYDFLKDKVSEKLGSFDLFCDLYPPSNTIEATSISMSECYADIYQDLKDFTLLYQLGVVDSVNEGLWECVQNFEQIWGPRVLVLLKEIHNLLFSGEDLTIEDNKNEFIKDKNDRFWSDELLN